MVSIIVPVYNAGEYISQCVESVLRQSFQDWELLLVNDGSTDNSAKICDFYAISDSRIRVIHKENTGVSDTRNQGIQLARGEYLIFLDADDYWCDDTILAQMVCLSERYNLDIIRGEYKAVDENNVLLFSARFSQVPYTSLIDSATFIEKAIKGEFFLVLSLFKKHLFDTLRLNTEQIFLEDMRLYAELMIRPLRCMYIPAVFYAYRKTPTSVSCQVNDRKLKDSFAMCDFFNTMISRADNKQLKEYFRYYSVMMYYWTLDSMSFNPYYQFRKGYIVRFTLDNLNKKVKLWAKDCSHPVPITIYLPPALGVIALRFRHRLGSYIRKFYIS